MKPTIKTDKYELYLGKAEDIMPQLPQGCVNAVITDPPFGTTACAWDTVIPFDLMWAGIKHVAKERAAIALFGSQPFTSALVMSNPKMFKYEWILEKDNGSNVYNAPYQPLKVHESVMIFGDAPTSFSPNAPLQYNPQFTEGKPYRSKRGRGGQIYHTPTPDYITVNSGKRYPRSVQKFNSERGLHPTQKSVLFLSYLIKTYANETETVLDFTMGSGSTGVAAIQNNRYFIGIESDEKYFEIAAKRLADCPSQGMLEFTQ